MLRIDKIGTLTKPGLRLMATEVVNGRPGAPITEVIGAVDEAPNETGRSLAAHYSAAPGWTVQRRVPFSSARKWSGVTFAGHGTWLASANVLWGLMATGRLRLAHGLGLRRGA